MNLGLPLVLNEACSQFDLASKIRFGIGELISQSICFKIELYSANKALFGATANQFSWNFLVDVEGTVAVPKYWVILPGDGFH